MVVNMKKIYDFSFVDVDGNEVSLGSFKGKYLLLVNVASECGFTGQYQQLQELYAKYKDILTIIGFPCNDFGGQEPGSEESIKAFCERKYHVEFPLSSKINIKKAPVNEIYNWLCNKSENGVMNSTVMWNFQKYLISPEGELLNFYRSNISPFNKRILSYLKST